MKTTGRWQVLRAQLAVLLLAAAGSAGAVLRLARELTVIDSGGKLRR